MKTHKHDCTNSFAYIVHVYRHIHSCLYLIAK